MTPFAEKPNPKCKEVEPDDLVAEPSPRLSAEATRIDRHGDGSLLSEAEIEAAEDEALLWARRANSC
jgi:hypothetical protein